MDADDVGGEFPFNPVDQQFQRRRHHFFNRLVDARDAHDFGQQRIVETDHADVFGHPEAPFLQKFDALQGDGRQSIQVEIDAAAGQISIRSDFADDRDHVLPVRMDEGLKLELFVDLYSLEVFVNHGEEVCTVVSYASKGSVSTVTAAKPVRLNKLENRSFRGGGSS